MTERIDPTNANAQTPAMSVKVEAGCLVIRLPLQTPAPSASGKTLVVGSTHGNVRTDCMVNGKPITVGVNCYIRA